ncbi:MAG: hypothetical protein KY457_14305 [Actinobacteria bacterium]|nr:hypothetical protein [Actinomycetota bacterium]
MSVRVNLLPGEVAERNRAARQRAGLAAGAVAFLGALGLVYLVQLNRVGDAQEQLEAEQARVAELQAEVADLQEFQELEQRAAASETVLVSALGDEASIAGVLQDLAAVMPSDAELNSISITVNDTAVAPVAGQTRASYGTITMSGRTLRGHAPGLERLLLELDKVASFSGLFFSSSAVDEANVGTFSVELNLGDEILTRRYLNGLPEELR